jgi:DNA-binding GntR family transcriptional regulator
MNSALAQGRLVDAIRDDLLAAHFAPGDRLVEIDLAERYTVPRAAVRTALVTLVAEGLVERQPHRGASVRALTIDEAIEIAEIRRELEALCAQHAAEGSSALERGELLGLVEAMRMATEGSRTSEYRELSVRFHERLADIADVGVARRFLREIRNHRLASHFPEAFEAGTTENSLEQHTAIARAVAAGDAETAERLMRDHVGTVVGLLEAHARAIGAAAIAVS